MTLRLVRNRQKRQGIGGIITSITRIRSRWCSAGALLGTGAALLLGAASASALTLPGPGAPQVCNGAQLPASTNPANPLDLPTAPPVGDPLSGAQFFVSGPTHGMAAGAIAQLLGIDPTTLPENLSFAAFWNSLASNPVLAAKLADPSIKSQVLALAKIAAQPEPQRLSLYSGGGGPGAILGQTQKILCSNMAADPGTVPILETFFVYPNGAYCPSAGQLSGNTGTFNRQVTEFAQGIGRNPAVVLTELDSIGSSACMNLPSVVHADGHTWTIKGAGSWEYWWSHHRVHGKVIAKYHKVFFPNAPHGAALSQWTADIAYEIAQVERYAPNTVIYTEGGYSDGNLPLWTAQMMNMVLSHLTADGGSTSRLRGFFTNDTHENWSANEVVWGDAVSNDLSSLTHGAYRPYFVVNTADNGQGPLIPPSRVKGGNEVLCNPPNRGLGIPNVTTPASLLTGGPGIAAGSPTYVDAFMWVHTPGRSSGTCNGGPPNAAFWPARAEQLASLANQQLGPGWPSNPW